MSYNVILKFTVKISKCRSSYCQAGKESPYICPQAKPDKAGQDNVLKALEHACAKAGHYLDAIDDLPSMLSALLRNKHMARRATLLRGKVVMLSGGRLP